MKKAIVTTTINAPTRALKKFIKIAERDTWQIFIVGDKKTPHEKFWRLEKDYDFIKYISPEDQEVISSKLSDLIGWNCIQRRNFGFIEAYRWGAEIIATVDDDNIPFENWGKLAPLILGQKIGVDIYDYQDDYKLPVFDPLSATSQGPNIWHRGFPVQLLKGRNKLKECEVRERTVLVLADLWNGDPDIDAICRIAKNPIVKFDDVKRLFAGGKPGPFNSQNTFLHRSVMPYYFMWPGIGRMDDIWAAYYLQRVAPNSVVYGPPSVFQDRNDHDLVKDLEAEMIGYRHTLDYAKWCFDPGTNVFPEFLPMDSQLAYVLYQELLNG